MPKYVQLEVDLVREIAKQETSDEESSTEAVSRDLILRFLSDADQRIQSRLYAEDPNATLFDKTVVIDSVGGQRAYSLPSDVYARDDIKLVEYSRTGQEQDYFPVSRLLPSQASNYRSAQFIEGFFIQAGEIYLSPIPMVSGQKIRITYPRGVFGLDIRRGRVSVNPPNDGTNYTGITVGDDEFLNEARVDKEQVLCICDRNGVVKRTNLEYTDYDTGTKTYTLASGYAIADGVISVGDFVTLGEYTTTHSELPKLVDRYRIAYAAWQIMKVTSNTDAASKETEVNALEGDIINKLKTNSNIPIQMPIGGFYV